MSTAWKSTDQESANRNSTNQPTNNTISATTLSPGTRQRELAILGSFAMIAVLLAAIACSKQSSSMKPADVAVSSPALPGPSVAAAVATPALPEAVPAKKQKAVKKRPANVTYTDANSGVSFLYPRKATLISGDKPEPELAAIGEVPMNFVHPGGTTVATVALPENSYLGTDFASAFFKVNVNPSVSEKECTHFAFVDTRNADGEPIDAEKVKVGDADMEMTSDFTASAVKQADTQYYHSYEKGACYEYVLGLGTEGFGTERGIEHVNRDQVFARLEKILATVKIDPVEHASVSEPAATTLTSGKE
jgi:hypothetical protein